VSARIDDQAARHRWSGPLQKYDLLIEGTIALGVMTALLVVLSTLFGSPKVAAISLKSWAESAPDDFAQAALAELLGTSATATYGPPYQPLAQQSGSVQSIGAFSPQTWFGVPYPIDAPHDLVLNPLASWSAFNPPLREALARWNGASSGERAAWGKHASAATLQVSGLQQGRRNVQALSLHVEGDIVKLDGKGDMGPIATLLGGMLVMARSGALDSQLLQAPAPFYSLDYTKPLMFLNDSPNYYANLAQQYAMGGEQWGVMNEIGSWPGQPWLWFYSMWYMMPFAPYAVGSQSIANGGPPDINVIATVTPIFILLFLLPVIPGLRDLPRYLGIYKIIWRDYYAAYGKGKRAE
jgi:hypothetical protein